MEFNGALPQTPMTPYPGKMVLSFVYTRSLDFLGLAVMTLQLW